MITMVGALASVLAAAYCNTLAGSCQETWQAQAEPVNALLRNVATSLENGPCSDEE